MDWYGWNGRIARIDLTKGKVHIEELDRIAARKFLGGRGLNSYTLFKEVSPGTDPLAPDNIVCFAPGTLTGTRMPMSSRIEVSTLSPYSGILGDGSAGGHFPHALKLAGFDQLVISGRSDKPVYLLVEDGNIEIKDAKELWGTTTWETDEALKDMHGQDVKVAAIGQAGENRVRMASTMFDRHSSAARGSGAVLGSKNLKAIAARGSGFLDVADPDGFNELAREDMDFFLNDPFQSRVVRTYGTHIGMVYWFPGYRYFKKYLNPEDVPEQLLPPRWKEYETGRYACFNCPVACKNSYRLPSGKYAGEENSGLEFEAIHCLGVNSGVEDPESIMTMANMADKYGMDVIALGNTIAYIKELYSRGIITREDTGGLDLTWENAEAQIELIEKITRREGFGNIAAEGLYNVARLIGGRAMDYCYHVKGLSRGVHPAGIMSLAHATGTRGADHLRGRTWAYGENDGELFREWVASGLIPDVEKDVVGTLTLCEKVTTMSDTIGRCKGAVTSWVAAVPLVWKYPIFGGVARYLTSATGMEFTERDVELAAERIYVVERSFNVRRGITARDDAIPMTPEMKNSAEGMREEEKHRALMKEYYKVHGYDTDTGIPTREKAEELDIVDVWETMAAGMPYSPWEGPPL